MTRLPLIALLLLALPARADDTSLVDVIRELQPAHDEVVAASWAGVFELAGDETGLDPLLLVALAFRESSLMQSAVGTRGEIGVLQLHGVSLRHLPHGCDVRELSCNVRGGAAFLQWVRATCGGSWSVWVAGYGLSRCPTEREAASLPSVRRARAIYERIGGERWR